MTKLNKHSENYCGHALQKISLIKVINQRDCCRMKITLPFVVARLITALNIALNAGVYSIE